MTQPTPPATPPPNPAAAGQRPPVPPEEFSLVAGLLAVLLPGLGHWYLREAWRAAGVAAGVLGLFFGGILIGGIDVVDRKEDGIWFLGQALVGPIAFGVDALHQSRFKALGSPPSQEAGGLVMRSGYPGERIDRSRGTPYWVAAPGAMPPSLKSVGKVNEIGTLYATIAGMLNLIAVLDAFFHRRWSRKA